MTGQDINQFSALGKAVHDLQRKLDVFERPQHIDRVTYTTDEVTALCPVTGQPDWYTVEIVLLPDALCIESKSLKLYLQSYRQEGLFCEQFAATIAEDLMRQLRPFSIRVTVTQKPRGGISIDAVASLGGGVV